jgi:hypothetical protein
MRTFVGICFLALVALGVPAAGANIDYEINFSGSGLLPTSGSFAYDSTTSMFSDFTVVWDGFTFDLTSPANLANGGDAGFPACIDGLTGGAGTFAMLSGNCDGAPNEVTNFDAAHYSNHNVVSFMTYNSVLVQVDGGGEVQQLSIYADAPISRPNEQRSFEGGWTISQVPEPSSLILLFVGLAPIALAVRRRGASQSRRVSEEV